MKGTMALNAKYIAMWRGDGCCDYLDTDRDAAMVEQMSRVGTTTSPSRRNDKAPWAQVDANTSPNAPSERRLGSPPAMSHGALDSPLFAPSSSVIASQAVTESQVLAGAQLSGRTLLARLLAARQETLAETRDGTATPSSLTREEKSAKKRQKIKL